MKEENDITQINEDLNVVTYEPEKIKDLIYTVQGKQVMLDSDVAMLYHYTTKNVNKAMKRNIDRFPEDFCFQLTESEVKNLRFQNGTSSLETENYGGRRYLPYAYTEQGISMLAGILKNEIAVQVSINIMRAFVEMRKFIANNGQVFDRLTKVEYKLLENDKKFDAVFNELQKDKETEFRQKIFFKNQIYDAYSLIIDIIKRAKTKILIIDNYIDDSILKISYTNRFHDRFILIDNKELYHCGASLKDLGKKCFAISKIEDMEYVEKMNKLSK